MTRTIVLLALLLQLPAVAAAPQPSCVAQSAPQTSDSVVGAIRVYACQTSTPGAPAYVSKPWFKAHCHREPQQTAACDALAVEDDALTVRQMAGPSTFRDRLKQIGEGAAYVGIGAAIVACLASGGCGALGGGA